MTNTSSVKGEVINDSDNRILIGGTDECQVTMGASMANRHALLGGRR